METVSKLCFGISIVLFSIGFTGGLLSPPEETTVFWFSGGASLLASIAFAFMTVPAKNNIRRW